MKQNIITGLLLIVMGGWMIKDESVGYGYIIEKKAQGIFLYSYTIPLILLGIYLIYTGIKNKSKF